LSRRSLCYFLHSRLWNWSWWCHWWWWDF